MFASVFCGTGPENKFVLLSASAYLCKDNIKDKDKINIGNSDG